MFEVSLFWIVVGILVWNSAVRVPTFHYGAVRRFKKLTGRFLEPGLHFVLPLIDDVITETVDGECMTSDLRMTAIEAEMVSKDKLKIAIKGSVQWRIDFGLIPTFINVDKDTILRGLMDAVKSELSVIAGSKEGEAFITKRQPIQDLINCVLRLKTPPHQVPCNFGAEEKDVAPENRLEFYERHMNRIKSEYISREKERVGDRSKIEIRYGIDIETFELAEVTFTEKTLEAFEKKQQEASKMQAAQVNADKKIELTRQYKELGLSPREAANEASVTVGQATKRVESLEGLEGIFGGKS